MKDIKRISTDIESWFATFFGWQNMQKLVIFPRARESSLGRRHGSRSLRQLLHPSMGPGWGKLRWVPEGGSYKHEALHHRISYI